MGISKKSLHNIRKKHPSCPKSKGQLGCFFF